MTRRLPQWATELLASCPKAGAGVHNWTYRASLQLHRHISDKNDLARLLAEATANCGREVTADEIESAVRNSQRVVENPTEPAQFTHRRPTRNEERIKAVLRDGPNLFELAASSPVRWGGDAPHTEEIIDALFPGNPFLCAGPRKKFWVTRTREEWRGFLAKQQFIVPNPMTAPFGKTQARKTSMRTSANTGPRRFVVVEFDSGSFDEQAAILKHLAKYAPLVLGVHSGNKSLHGWFLSAGEPETAVEKFFRYAESLGACHATWTQCQLVRMPDGQRENGKRQRVVFFNPKGAS